MLDNLEGINLLADLWGVKVVDNSQGGPNLHFVIGPLSCGHLRTSKVSLRMLLSCPFFIGLLIDLDNSCISILHPEQGIFLIGEDLAQKSQ